MFSKNNFKDSLRRITNSTKVLLQNWNCKVLVKYTSTNILLLYYSENRRSNNKNQNLIIILVEINFKTKYIVKNIN